MKNPIVIMWSLFFAIAFQGCQQFFKYTPPTFDFYLSGEILNMKISNNHAFGIFVVKVDSVSGHEKGDFLANKKPLICQFNRTSTIAEIYGPVLGADSPGYRITIHGRKGITRVYNPKGIEVSFRYLVLEPEEDDKLFIAKNSLFRSVR